MPSVCHKITAPRIVFGRTAWWILGALPMSSPAESDAEPLLARAAAGDRSAVSELLAMHRARLKQVVCVRLDRRLAARVDSSDVVQETLAEAARRMPDFLQTRPLPFFAWLRQLAWNRLVDLYRFH